MECKYRDFNTIHKLFLHIFMSEGTMQAAISTAKPSIEVIPLRENQQASLVDVVIFGFFISFQH